MSDDTIGWILLSIVAGLASAGVVTAGSVLSAVGRVVAFMIISFTVGRWLVKRLLDFVQDETVSPDRLVTLVVALTFAWGAVTQALHLEAVLGAFVMGILFGQMPRLPEATHQKLITIAIGVFTPIFFATAGLKVNVRELLEPRLIALTLLVVFVAMAGKITGTYAGARLIGRREHWTALAFGAGLNARGAMEIIIATIGLQLGILSREMFSIVVLMAMATSLMAPPAMRFVLKRIRPEQQELDRLKREALADESWIARVHRVLLPARERRVSDETRRLEAFLLERMSRNGPLSLTLLTVTEADRKEGAAAFVDELAKRFGGIELTRKVVVGSAAGQVILDEARKDYDVILLGATERPPGAGVLFHPLIDETVRMAPCPTLVARGGPLADGWVPRRILVPTNGSQAARNAAELAFVLAGEPEQEVTVLHVIQERAGAFHPYTRSHAVERDAEMARGIVDELRQLGDAHGVRTRALVRRSSDPEREILELTHAGQAELVIIGTDVRPASGRLYLGPRVERVLESAACPVVVVNSA
jgi:nucleotide-binding universal stress UspA family protein